RFGRGPVPPKRSEAAPRLAFLYSAAMREPPDSLGHVAVTRHRIVKQNARKIYVECNPFDEDEWARRSELDEGSTEEGPKTRTLTVDRTTLRKEGRFQSGRTHQWKTFYASEDDGIRDVEAALTAKYAWCAELGVRFPCSVDTIKAAYRRLARGSHPDAGGNAEDFRTLEQAYREALAYFSQGEGTSV
ncbi:DnaJ domain-containing protein, partial [Singulisphaera rosea]